MAVKQMVMSKYADSPTIVSDLWINIGISSLFPRQVKQDIIINEIQIMKESHHASIVNYIDSYIVEGTLWVVMELINGGSLAELIEVPFFFRYRWLFAGLFFSH